MQYKGYLIKARKNYVSDYTFLKIKLIEKYLLITQILQFLFLIKLIKTPKEKKLVMNILNLKIYRYDGEHKQNREYNI